MGAIAAALFIVVGIGPPLIGRTTFHGADTAANLSPWFEERTTAHDESVAPLNDTFDASAPKMIEASQRARHGDFAPTDTYGAGGDLVLATPATGSLDPMNLPWLLLPARLAPAYAQLLELAAAIGFTYLFCRRLGLRPAASWLAGIVYSSTGFQVAWTNWPQTHAAALIPAMLWSAERILVRRGWRDVGVLALVVAASVVAGFPAVSLYGA
jgi:hypothetical protein